MNGNGSLATASAAAIAPAPAAGVTFPVFAPAAPLAASRIVGGSPSSTMTAAHSGRRPDRPAGPSGFRGSTRAAVMIPPTYRALVAGARPGSRRESTAVRREKCFAATPASSRMATTIARCASTCRRRPADPWRPLPEGRPAATLGRDRRSCLPLDSLTPRTDA